VEVAARVSDVLREVAEEWLGFGSTVDENNSEHGSDSDEDDDEGYSDGDD
jgi:hypothetical protein